MNTLNHLAACNTGICTRNIYNTSSMKITGRIMDIDTNLPIESVNVYLKNNTTIGTTTDAAGYYSLEADPNEEIVMSHVQFGTLIIPAKDIQGNEFMQTAINALDTVDLGIVKKRQQAGFGLLMAALLAMLVISNRKPSQTIKASI